jgi:hypothetical protein
VFGVPEGRLDAEDLGEHIVHLLNGLAVSFRTDPAIVSMAG